MALVKLIKLEDGKRSDTYVNPHYVVEVRSTVMSEPAGEITVLTMRDGRAVLVKEDIDVVVATMRVAMGMTPTERLVHYQSVSGKHAAICAGAVLGIVDHGDHRELALKDGRMIHVTTPYTDLARQITT